MRKLTIIATSFALILALAMPALAWRARVRPVAVVRIPTVVVKPVPAAVRPAPVVVRQRKVVVVKPTPVCPQGWHWSSYYGRCRYNW